jgi:hypothetical protein
VVRNVTNLAIALFMDYNKHNNRKKSGVNL